MAAIPSGIAVWWPSTHASIPSGWTRNTNFDDRYSKGTAVSTDPNNTGGSATHTHTSSNHNHTLDAHTHGYTTGTEDSGGHSSGGGGDTYQDKFHYHTGTSGSIGGSTSGNAAPSWAAGSSDPAFYDMIYIESDGVENGFPDGCVIMYDSGSAPTNWTAHSGSQQKYIQGASSGSGNGGGTGGGNHTHAASGSHTHTADTSSHNHGSAASGTGGSTVQKAATGLFGYADEFHTHPIDLDTGTQTGTATATTSGATGGYTNLPPYHILLGIENTKGSNDWLKNGIVMWLGTLANIPNGWTLCDGGSSTPDLRDKYILMASSGGADVGNTGGIVSHTNSSPSTHTHSGSTSHTHSYPNVAGGASGGPNAYMSAGEDGSGAGHSHGAGTSDGATPGYGTGTQSVDSNSDAQPAFRTVAYLQAPAEPTDAIFFGHAF